MLGCMDSHRIAAAIVTASLFLLVPSVGANEAKPPQKKGATYSGISSQGQQCYFDGQDGEPCSVFVKVSDNGHKVKLAQVFWRAPCTGGNGDVVYRSNTVFHNLKINDKAKYKNSSSYVENLSDGAVAENSVKTHGKFTRKNGKRRLAGDFSIESDLTGADGTKFHCESGTVTFTAKP